MKSHKHVFKEIQAKDDDYYIYKCKCGIRFTTNNLIDLNNPEQKRLIKKLEKEYTMKQQYWLFTMLNLFISDNEYYYYTWMGTVSEFILHTAKQKRVIIHSVKLTENEYNKLKKLY